MKNFIVALLLLCSAGAYSQQGRRLAIKRSVADPNMATRTFVMEQMNQVRNFYFTDGLEAVNDSTARLANTTVTPGTYGSATQVPQITVDAKGRITNATNVAISGGGGSPGYTVLLTRSVTAKDTFNVDLTAWHTTYDVIRIEIYNAAPVTDGAIAWLRVSSDGVNYDAGASNYVWMYRLLSQTGFTGDAATNGTALVLSHTDGVDNAANVNFSSTLEIRDPDLSQKQIISVWSRYANNAGTMYWYQGNGVRDAQQILRGIQFQFSTGNISKATIKVIGCN